MDNFDIPFNIGLKKNEEDEGKHNCEISMDNRCGPLYDHMVCPLKMSCNKDGICGSEEDDENKTYSDGCKTSNDYM